MRWIACLRPMMDSAFAGLRAGRCAEALPASRRRCPHLRPHPLPAPSAGLSPHGPSLPPSLAVCPGRSVTYASEIAPVEAHSPSSGQIFCWFLMRLPRPFLACPPLGLRAAWPREYTTPPPISRHSLAPDRSRRPARSTAYRASDARSVRSWPLGSDSR